MLKMIIFLKSETNTINIIKVIFWLK